MKSDSRFPWISAMLVLLISSLFANAEIKAAEPEVRIGEQSVVLPTYEVGPADPNPMFYTNESYQGAQKRIYPYPLQDHLTHKRSDKKYTWLNLENEYVKLGVLPEMGGRLFSAVDKTNDYPFFYRQHVIKPALIGMLGAWISGGVEWCAFHHHRNTTFMPVDYTLVENPDGSKTIWFGETERRHRMRWLIGLTLYPDKSYVETTVKFFNRTAQPHSVLYWANVAVHVNDQYQVIFPPSIQVATYHSKIDFTHWPIGRGKYRGHDYTDVDISWWKNSPVSNSFFAWNLREDFMGGYDHDRQAGMVHVGNHHVVCSAKLWEWGTGSYGRTWDKILTDEDGPYAELMVGAFSDNQPDYSWIKPHEVKSFKQYWYPIRGIGGFKNANLNGAVNLKTGADGVAEFGFCATSQRKDAKVVLTADGKIVFEQRIAIGPDKPFTAKTAIPAGTDETDLRLALISAAGEELIAYQPVKREPVDELPAKVQAPSKPEDIETIEELYLTGLRVEQIHNPSVDPTDYYREALKRDPHDSRCNTVMGIHCNKQGRYADAETHLRKAIDRVSAEYTRPQNAEAYYQLGLALRSQHKDDAAYDAFYRATWDQAFHSAAYFQLAELSSGKRNYVQALEHIQRALSTNALDTKALGLKAGLLRKSGRAQRALKVAEVALQLDPLDFRAMNEIYLARSAMNDGSAQAALDDLTGKMRGDVQAYLELATDYFHAQMWDEAMEVLRRPIDKQLDFAATYPMLHYFLGYARQQRGDTKEANTCFARAASQPTRYCFPFRLEALDVLEAALAANPRDGRAYYYLGNLLFDLQPDRAIEYWEKSRAIDGSLATVHRNLGWAYYRVKKELRKAIDCYEQALACGELDPRPFLELDRLYEIGNVSPQQRLAALEPHHEIVAQRQDSFIRELMVLVLAGKYESAIRHLDDNSFSAQEGREEIHDVYVDAHLLLGLQRMKQGDDDEALRHFQRAQEYPENLSVGRPQNDPRAPQVAYYTGKAYEALGDRKRARECFQKAADQSDTARWPETRFYQALSWKELGKPEASRPIFADLVESGKRRLAEDDSADFFAKFGQQESRKSKTATAHFILGLGLLGEGDIENARQELGRATAMNLSHVWAAYHAASLIRNEP